VWCGSPLSSGGERAWCFGGASGARGGMRVDGGRGVDEWERDAWCVIRDTYLWEVARRPMAPAFTPSTVMPSRDEQFRRGRQGFGGGGRGIGQSWRKRGKPFSVFFCPSFVVSGSYMVTQGVTGSHRKSQGVTGEIRAAGQGGAGTRMGRATRCACERVRHHTAKAENRNQTPAARGQRA